MEKFEKFEKSKTIKPVCGTWDKLDAEPKERRPKIEFEFGKEVIVIMQCDQPREIQWEDGVFYVFEVLEKGVEKSIVTSAWSLLRGLKSFEPLDGKTLKILKLMEKGKQVYKVSTNEEKIK